MRNKFLLILLLCCNAMVQAQTPYTTTTPYQANEPQTASVLVRKHRPVNANRMTRAEKCYKYRRVQVAGIVLTSLGGAFAIAGASMLTVGVNSNIQSELNGNLLIAGISLVIDALYR